MRRNVCGMAFIEARYFVNCFIQASNRTATDTSVRKFIHDPKIPRCVAHDPRMEHLYHFVASSRTEGKTSEVWA